MKIIFKADPLVSKHWTTRYSANNKRLLWCIRMFKNTINLCAALVEILSLGILQTDWELSVMIWQTRMEIYLLDKN